MYLNMLWTTTRRCSWAAARWMLQPCATSKASVAAHTMPVDLARVQACLYSQTRTTSFSHHIRGFASKNDLIVPSPYNHITSHPIITATGQAVKEDDEKMDKLATKIVKAIALGVIAAMAYNTFPLLGVCLCMCATLQRPWASPTRALHRSRHSGIISQAPLCINPHVCQSRVSACEACGAVGSFMCSDCY